MTMRALQPTALFATDILTKAGGRNVNEDSCDYAEAGNTACWVVADGLGGHTGGKDASSIVVEAVLASFLGNPEFSADALASYLEAAQLELVRWQKKDPALVEMRSTVVVLLTDFRQILWAHIGDSRFYCLDDGWLACRTEDHSLAQALVKAGRISEEAARHHPDRNRLLQSLGDAVARPTIHPKPRPLYRGTAVLLCTDGFWEHVTDTEMLVDLAKSVTPDAWLARMEARLLERVPDGHDNYTAVAVFFSSALAPPPRPRPLVSTPAVRRLRSTAGVLMLVAACLVALALAATRIDSVRNWSRAWLGKVTTEPTTMTVDKPANVEATGGKSR